MEKVSLRQFTKAEKSAFYQSKYEYYSFFTFILMTVACISYLSFFLTDCSIFGRFAYETLFSRLFILIPYAIFIIVGRNVKDYRIMAPLNYLMIHIIIWCTDWATYLLPDRQHAISGMIIMHLVFVCAGFAAPLKYSIPAHLLMIVDIAVADLFIHYDNLQMMYLFNLPCIFAVCITHIVMQKVYLEHYLNKEKLKKLVVHDQLTQVYNRNKLKEISNDSSELVVFSDIAVSMMLVDIDYFKRVNDDYGHEAGDRVLEFLATSLKDSVRVTDFVIRWGGEEFLVLMPGCVGEQAYRVAEKVRAKIEETDNGVCPITVSIGVAEHTGGDYHNTIKNADNALYDAKHNGRNAVVLYKGEVLKEEK